MKKYNLSLMVLNNNREYEVDKKVSTNSKEYAQKKLDYDGNVQYYYFGFPKLYDNNKQRFLNEYEEMTFWSNNLI